MMKTPACVHSTARPSARTGLRAALSGVALACTLAACGGGSSGSSPTPNPGAGGYPGGADIIAWGDSWTSGVGATTGFSFPEQLESLTSRPVFNAGVSGQTSDQIVARQGGAPALLTLPGNSLPGSGQVTIAAQSTFPVSAEGPGPISGTLAGVHGLLGYASGNLVFESDLPGAAISVPAQSPFDPDPFDSRTRINVFWIGGNNLYDPDGVKADVASAVAFLSTSRFIVLSILNSATEPSGSPNYDVITQLNADLAAAYPSNYIDIRAVLVDSYNPADPQDVADHASDLLPTSLRNDDQHPNEAGYAVVAETVADFIQTKGW
jgi:hypothetical protein